MSRLTNVEFVTRLMESSRSGALMQAFVLTAIEKYAEQCVKAGPAVFDSNSLRGAAWVRCADEAGARIAAHTAAWIGRNGAGA